MYSFCNDDLNKFILLLRKGIAGKNLMRHHYQVKKIFIVT